jgi:hypothetical protein
VAADRDTLLDTQLVLVAPQRSADTHAMHATPAPHRAGEEPSAEGIRRHPATAREGNSHSSGKSGVVAASSFQNQ